MSQVCTSFDINTHEFDVAFSFPGEHRAYVKAVVDALLHNLNADKIFYDEYYKAFLAIPSSDTLLQDIYRTRSGLVVLFLCEKYQEKQWCGLEARAIRDLIKEQQNERIMLIRMDDGKVCGDVDYEGVAEKTSYITPVPGGVGPMTIAMLMANVVKATKNLMNNY